MGARMSRPEERGAWLVAALFVGGVVAVLLVQTLLVRG